MRRLIAILLLSLPSLAQTFAGRAGSDIFILPPFRFCLGEDNGKNVCFVQTGNQIARSSGALDYQLPAYTVSTLPAASAEKSRLVVVTDGQTASDCSIGGSTTSALCMSNGSNWIGVGAGAGGNIPCSSVNSNITTDAGCGASANPFAYSAAGGSALRHGWNYYFQTDMTQVNNPYGFAVNGGEIIPSSGQVATDVWTVEFVNSVTGGNADSSGTQSRVMKLRSVLIGAGTTHNGNMTGITYYLPTVGAGTTLNGGFTGLSCDAAGNAGTWNGGYVCVTGPVFSGVGTNGDSSTQPAYMVTATATQPAFCWGTLGSSSIFTSTNCSYAGSGSPAGAVTAPVGSVYYDYTNGLAYVKNSGTGNTGWVEQVPLLPPTAVGSLPSCTAALEGFQAVASNCNAGCSAGGTCTAGGSTHCQVYCNSSPAYVETGR